jgi:hypothetical protein
MYTSKFMMVSGHGVCGLPRLSLRSLTAVSTFMLTGTVGALLGRQIEQNHVSVSGMEALLELMGGSSDSAHGGHLPSALVAVGVFTLFSAMRAKTQKDPTVVAKKTDGDKVTTPSPTPSTNRLVCTSSQPLGLAGGCV